MSTPEERAHRAESQSDRWEARADSSEARYRRNWWGKVVMVVWLVLAPAVVYALSVYNTRQSEKAWCEIITVLDDAYKAAPPTTDTGRRIAVAMVGIRRSYGC